MEKKTQLDISQAFDEAKCKSLLCSIMAVFGLSDQDAIGAKGGEPKRTLRQVARMIAVETGFDCRCVARVCLCQTVTVNNAGKAIGRRIKKQATGKNNPMDNHALTPVVEKAMSAAREWGAKNL